MGTVVVSSPSTVTRNCPLKESLTSQFENSLECRRSQFRRTDLRVGGSREGFERKPMVEGRESQRIGDGMGSTAA